MRTSVLIPMVVFGVLAPGVASAQCPADLWVLTWADEFDGPAGPPNAANWTAETGRWPYNEEWETYLPAANTVSDGALTITSTRDSRYNPAYVSGRVHTRGHFAQMFGRFEMRAKLPKTKGVWPAFWLLPDGRWPPEIDIMEFLGHDVDTVYFTNHWGVYPAVASQGSNFSGPDFSADFHTYAVEWFPDRIDWFVDGVKRATHRNAGVPQEPMYIILNTAVGGTWPGYPDATTVLPQRFVIDYVRAYSMLEPEQRLNNAGFEQVGAAGSTAITSWGRFGQAYSEPANSRTGSRAGKVYGNFSGSANSSGVWQDSPAAAGEVWAASGWFLNRSDDRMQGGNTATLAIEWRSGAGQVLRTDSVTALNAQSPTDVYMRSLVHGEAPANTATARLLIRFTQPQNAAGAAFFDDVVLGPVACPGAPCAADFNGDGGVDGSDVQAFFHAWSDGHPSADMNADGGVDGADVESFFTLWEAGGC